MQHTKMESTHIVGSPIIENESPVENDSMDLYTNVFATSFLAASLVAHLDAAKEAAMKQMEAAKEAEDVKMQQSRAALAEKVSKKFVELITELEATGEYCPSSPSYNPETGMMEHAERATKKAKTDSPESPQSPQYCPGSPVVESTVRKQPKREIKQMVDSPGSPVEETTVRKQPKREIKQTVDYKETRVFRKRR